MLGVGAYADGSRLIDDNIRAFKGIKQETELLNKKLQAEAGQQADLDTLKNLGQEMAFTQGKKLFAKYGSDIYSGKIPFTNNLSIEDLDKEAGKGLDNVLDRAFSAGKNIPPPLNNASNATINMKNNLNMISGDPEIDAIRESNLYSRSLNATGLPISSERPMVAKTEEVEISKPSSSSVQMTEMKEGVSEGVSKDVSEVGESVASGLGEDVATEEGLQATAGVFASTGILAPLATGIEVGADVFALYETGKSIVDWFDRDVLHQTAPTAQQVSLPSQPKTLAQKGFLITPSVDTYDIPHNSISSSW
jgi:hypothetical protein